MPCAVMGYRPVRGQGHGEGHLPPGELTSNKIKNLLERFYYVKLCLECGSLKNMRQLSHETGCGWFPLHYWSMLMLFFFFFFFFSSCFRPDIAVMVDWA